MWTMIIHAKLENLYPMEWNCSGPYKACPRISLDGWLKPLKYQNTHPVHCQYSNSTWGKRSNWKSNDLKWIWSQYSIVAFFPASLTACSLVQKHQNCSKVGATWQLEWGVWLPYLPIPMFLVSFIFTVHTTNPCWALGAYKFTSDCELFLICHKSVMANFSSLSRLCTFQELNIVTFFFWNSYDFTVSSHLSYWCPLVFVHYYITTTLSSCILHWTHLQFTTCTIALSSLCDSPHALFSMCFDTCSH
jgi:hypothetical protein